MQNTGSATKIKWHSSLTRQLPLCISLLSLGLFAIVKFYWRNLSVESDSIRFLLGVIPNFLAGLLIPMLFVLDYYKLPLAKINVFDIKITLVVIFSLLFLIIEEFRPTLLASKVFDYWDIIFSVFGEGVFLYVFKVIRTARLKQIIENQQ
jgi:hypothetical protein